MICVILLCSEVFQMTKISVLPLQIFNRNNFGSSWPGYKRNVLQ